MSKRGDVQAMADFLRLFGMERLIPGAQRRIMEGQPPAEIMKWMERECPQPDRPPLPPLSDRP